MVTAMRDRITARYESLRELIVWMAIAELSWLAAWLLRPRGSDAGYTATVVVWIAAMLVWIAFVIILGKRGFFLKHTRHFSNLIGLALVVGFAGILFGASQASRDGVVAAASGTSDVQLASIHILRLLAVGAFVKYRQGELPLHFALLGALPDFLFAVSAVVVALAAANGALPVSFLIAWHWTGMLLFVGAGASMFFSVPSPLRIHHGQPDTSIVFRFPMLLAPNATVPLFMLGHAFALVKLYGG